jgi:hypothetical protein
VDVYEARLVACPDPEVGQAAVSARCLERPAECIEYSGIRISEALIAELDGPRLLVTVKRSNIERVTLRRGWQSRRPFLVLLFGAGLFVIGLFPIRVILRWLLHGGEIHGALLVIAAFLLVFGVWVVYDSLRRGFFLRIEGPQGRQKLCFGRRAVRRDIHEFLCQAEERFGYQFERAFEADRTPV